MLNFKNISLLFILSELILFLLLYFQLINPIFILLTALIYLLFLIFGSVYIKRNFYLKSISKLKNNKAILLSFDDGPDPEITPKILKVLETYNRKAIFFLIGEKAEKFPTLVKELLAKGHSIGNHSYTHGKYFDLQSSTKMAEEIKKTTKILEDISGDSVPYFRPPYGVTNPILNSALKKTNLISVAWSFRSFDTGKRNAEAIAQRVKKEIKGGEILLFHDNREKSLEILKLVMPFLSKFEQGEIEYDVFD